MRMITKEANDVIDREKVIKAVEEVFDLIHSDFIGVDNFDKTEWESIKADALAMFKEPEPMKSLLMEKMIINDSKRIDYRT